MMALASIEIDFLGILPADILLPGTSAFRGYLYPYPMRGNAAADQKSPHEYLMLPVFTKDDNQGTIRHSTTPLLPVRIPGCPYSCPP